MTKYGVFVACATAQPEELDVWPNGMLYDVSYDVTVLPAAVSVLPVAGGFVVPEQALQPKLCIFIPQVQEVEEQD